MTAPRSASPQTAAATAARKKAKAQKCALEAAVRLPLLDDDWLTVLRRVVDDEIRLRARIATTHDVTQSDVTDSQPSINTTTESE